MKRTDGRSLKRPARLLERAGFALAVLALLTLSLEAAAGAIVPNPSPGHAVISVKVGGDRTTGGGVGGLAGVTLQLHDGSGLSPGAAHSSAWSWTTCVSDADGDCNFVIPIRSGAPSSTGVASNTRFWVVQTDGPAGWYTNPSLRTGHYGASPEDELPYRFRTDTQLQPGVVYRSTDPLPNNLANDASRGFMRNRRDGDDQAGRAAQVNRTLGIWSQSRINPEVPNTCGIDLALVVDTSLSLGSSGITQAKQAMNTFVDALRGTPSRVGLFSFSYSSPGSDAGPNQPIPQPVATSEQANQFKSLYSEWSAGGGTNWDHGLSAVARSGQSYDVVLMITDGNPTVEGSEAGSSHAMNNSLRDVDAGIFSANQLKAAKTTVIAIGVGTAVTSPLSALNLRAISGQDEDTDYFRKANFGEVGDLLAGMATANCQGSVVVEKMMVPRGGTIADAVPADDTWTFSAASQTTGVNVTAPTSTTTDADGKATFGLSFTGGATTGRVSVTETQKPNHVLVPVDGANAVCTDTETKQPVPVTNRGNAAAPGFEFGVEVAKQISCRVYNQELPGQWTLSKASDPPSGSTVAAGSRVVYTLTAENDSGSAVGSVAVSDDLSDVLSNATFDGFVNDDGGRATRSGDDLSWDVGTLAAGETRTISYAVVLGPDAHGVTIENMVVGDGEVPPRDCAASAPVPQSTEQIAEEPCRTDHHTPATWTLSKSSNPASGSVVAPGSTVTYTLTAVNTSEADVADVVVSDDLSGVLGHAVFGSFTDDDGGRASRSGDGLSWDVGTLAAGETRTVSYTVVIDADAHGVTIGNLVLGTGDVPPDQCVAVLPTLWSFELETLQVEDPCQTTHTTPATWTLAKGSDPASGSEVEPGSTVTYTLTAVNTSEADVADVVVSDDLSGVLGHAVFGSFTDDDGGRASRSGDGLSWDVGTLAAGETRTVSYTVVIDADAHGVTIGNVAVGDGDVPPDECAVQEPCETTHSTPATWSLSKTSDPTSGSIVEPGSTVTYTLTAVNTSEADVADVVISDDLSGVLGHAVFGSFTDDDGGRASRSGDDLSWDVGTLAAGETRTVSYTVVIDADAHGVTIGNVAVGDGAVPPDECVVEEPCGTEHRTPPAEPEPLEPPEPPGPPVEPQDPPVPPTPRPGPGPRRGSPTRLGPLPVTGSSVMGLIALGGASILAGLGLRRKPRASSTT